MSRRSSRLQGKTATTMNSSISTVADVILNTGSQSSVNENLENSAVGGDSYPDRSKPNDDGSRIDSQHLQISEFDFLSNKRDIQFFFEQQISESLLSWADEAQICRWPISEVTKLEISKWKIMAQNHRKEVKEMTTKRLLNPVPQLKLSEILDWAREFEKWLVLERVEPVWYHYLRAATSVIDFDTIERVQMEGNIDPSSTFLESFPRIYKAFFPIYSRSDALARIENIRPKVGELVNEFCERFNSCCMVFVDTDIPSWLFVEGFCKALPKPIMLKMHETNGNSSNYSSLQAALNHLRQLWSPRMNQPLVNGAEQSDKGFNFRRRTFGISNRPYNPLRINRQQSFDKPKTVFRGFSRPNDDMTKGCSICGRPNHNVAECVAKTYIDRTPIPPHLLSPQARDNVPKPSVKSESNSGSISSSVIPYSKGKSFPTTIGPRVVKPVNGIDETKEVVEAPLVDPTIPEEYFEDDLYEDSYYADDVMDLNMIIPISALKKHIPNSDGFLYCPLILNGSIQEHALVDSGAKVSVIDKNWIMRKLPDANLSPETFTKLQSFCGEMIDATLSLELEVSCVNIQGSIRHKFFVTTSQYPVICGLDLMSRLHIGVSNIPVAYPEIQQGVSIQVNTIEGKFGRIDAYTEILKEIERNQMTKNLPCSHPEALICLQVDQSKLRPVPQYPIEHAYRPFVDKQVKEWLDESVITEASETYVFCSPILTVPKYAPDGSVDKTSRRICLDARRLNEALITTDSFPIPVIRDLFLRLKGAIVFSEIDLRQAYTQCPIDPSTQYLLGFNWNGNVYVFQRAIFGLRFMTSRFQRIMRAILCGIPGVEVYVDNVIIFSRTLEEHIKTIILVLKRLTQSHLTIGPGKCQWLLPSIRLLGHMIDESGIRVDPSKFEIVNNMKIPVTGPQLEAALGLFNYFRSFLPRYSQIAAPLEAIRKQPLLQWNETHQRAFELLKTGICNADILKHPDFNLPFHLATDASFDGIAAILFQRVETSDHIIECASRSLTMSERNYSATKIELLAVIFGLKRFRQYLIGQRFTLYTDHSALTSLFRAKFDFNVLINGWFETIVDFLDYMSIEHLPGVSNVLPDLLSRTYKMDVKDVNGIQSAQDEEDFAILLNDDDENVAIIPPVESEFGLPHNSNENEKSDGITVVEDPRRKRELLQHNHLFGHFGPSQLVKRVRTQGFTWPGILKDATTLIDECPTCQKYQLTREGYHPLKHLNATYPMEWLVADLFGPLPVTPLGNTFVLVLVDVATRFVFLRPLPDKSAKSVASAFINIFCEFGFPKILSSDNDPCFLNHIIESLKSLWPLDQRTITPYHPRANGLAERNVRLAKQVLKRVMDDSVKVLNEEAEKFVNWDIFLPPTEFSMNSHVNETLKTSSFELLFGHPMMNMEDYSEAVGAVMSPEELKKHWDRVLDEIYPRIERMKKEKQTQTDRTFERTHHVISNPLSPGTVVMKIIDGVGVGIKRPIFSEIYDGPYVIMGMNRAGNYSLRELATDNYADRSCPIDKLKVLHGKVTVMEIVAERKQHGVYAKLVEFSDGVQLWVDACADLLNPMIPF